MVEHVRRLRLARYARLISCGALLIAVCAGSAILFVASAGAADRGPAAPDRPVDSSKQQIDALIEKLGSPRFYDRRTAATELEKIGPEAFDQLQAATEAADPEIAASTRYLLRRINVRWTRGDDTERVRRALRNYGDQSEETRATIVEALAGLERHEGLAALCRIVRFDHSGLVARQAAAAIIHRHGRDEQERSVDPEVLDRELGTSKRITARWLRQYRRQLGDPAATVPGWQQLVDDEMRRLEESVDETSPAVVSALLWNLAELHHQLGETEPLVDVLSRLVQVNEKEVEQLVWRALEWFIDREAWDAMDQFAGQHGEPIRRTKSTLYLLAVAREKQGRADVAQQLADEAYELVTQRNLDSVSAGRVLAAMGYFDWAVREYRRSTDTRPVKSLEHVFAAVLLSNLLHDYEQYDEAAAALEPLKARLEKDPKFVREYQQYQKALFHLEVRLLDATSVSARYHFARALHFAEQGDASQQREQLQKAIVKDEEDADILIAMYHVEEADDAWRAATLKRIERLNKIKEQAIAESPDNPDPYNQWAWLVANTEGDYQKAVRYSRRSLELQPDQAGFLDTLGRCYYSAGDYENAVKYQRQAVERIPHMQVMRRQLAQFEQTLAEKGAEKTGAEAEGRGAGEVN